MKTKNLVIVESPAKAETISKFLGDDYVVRASYGHVRDLPKTKLGVNVTTDFSPDYLVSQNRQTLRALKEIQQLFDPKTTPLFLATDEDREGEAIGWHLLELLQPHKKNQVKRIVFHEITQDAILHALETPRDVDKNLVDAQQARRILDRLVGYELSPILWKTVKTGLSAGRVQSVALRFVVEREREVLEFSSISNFRILAVFVTDNGQKLSAELNTRFETIETTRDFLETCLTSHFSVEKSEKKRAKKSPAPPFITSTLQQEASRKLGFSVKKTMMIAQRLYETGKITYMRTDSVHLSELAQENANHVIVSSFGKEYAQPRHYKTTAKGAQEAHEAIRPTDFSVTTAGQNHQEQRLYDLIWQRAIASQMADAQFDRSTVTIAVSSRSEKFIARGEMIVFEGFLKVYQESSDNGDENQENQKLPIVKPKEILTVQGMNATEKYSRPPARYSEASLVRKLEEMGIGRPSTYAPTISTIIDRGYVTLESKPGTPRLIHTIAIIEGAVQEATHEEMAGAEKNKLFPTTIGCIVSDFLVTHFPDIVDYQFTAKIEKEFDDIAEGKQDWRVMIESFYRSFHPIVLEKKKTVTREDTLPVRELGDDPDSGSPVTVRMGPYGPYVQLGERKGKKKPKSVSLPSGLNFESVTQEEALQLFRLPRLVGNDETGKEILANIGPFGPYVKIENLFISIDPLSPFDITLEEALLKIAEKKSIAEKKLILEFPDSSVKVLNGRWGPYVTDGRRNRTVPRSVKKNPEELTLEECMEILDRPKRTRGQTGQTKKKK